MSGRLFGVLASAAASVASIALVGCTSAPARRPNVVHSAELRANPRLAEGQRVFMTTCNQCHPGGAAGLGPSLADKPLPGWVIKFQVRHGLGAMPSFSSSQISEAQLADVVHYLKYLHDHPNGPSRS